MDGRTDLSTMQMHRGMRPKSYFDKEMVFTPVPEQMPTLISRIPEQPDLLINNIDTIQNYSRDAASFTPSDHIRRQVSNIMEGRPLNPLSRKTLYSIHKAGNRMTEDELIKTALHYNQLLLDQVPEAQWQSAVNTSVLIKEADQALEIIEEKIN